MIRAEFRPAKGQVFRGVKNLRHSSVERVSAKYSKAHGLYSEYRVTFENVDDGKHPVNTIPVSFYFTHISGSKEHLPKSNAKVAVLNTMAMQDIVIPGADNKGAFGKEGKELYRKYNGYGPALVSLATFLHKKGVERILIPTANTVHIEKPGALPKHALGKIYDKTAKRLGLEGPFKYPLDLNDPGHRQYYMLHTKDYAHLTDYLDRVD